MNKAPPQKLCCSCEGSIPLHSQQCPYCGASTNLAQPPSWDTSTSPSSPVDFLHTLYPPIGQKAPSPPPTEPLQPTPSPSPPPSPSSNSPPTEESSLFFLLPGSILCLFGLLLSFFSRDGRLTLVWETDYSLLYLLLGLALFFWGIKKFRRGSDESF